MPAGCNNGIVPALAGIIRRKGEFLYQHSLMVGALAQASAQIIGMAEEEADAVAVAGLLHDLGKIAIRTEVLVKPDKLSGHEWEQMKLHPRSAASTLARMKGMEHIANIILHHHESADGRGYPLNIQDEHIPLESKIIRVCDVFSAMATEKPYRPMYSFEYAAQAALDRVGLREETKAKIYRVFEVFRVDKEKALIHIESTFRLGGCGMSLMSSARSGDSYKREANNAERTTATKVLDTSKRS